MLGEKELEQEYLSALKIFKSIDKRKNEFITLHIPECAVCPTLLDVLGKIQIENSVRFVTVLDSEYHNDPQHPYDIGRPAELTYSSKGNLCRLNILFSNNLFSRKLFSFPPELAVKDLAFWYFTAFFESIAKPQLYPYWDTLKSGSDVCFVIHTDAETIGFHQPERIYSFFLFVHLLKSFNFKLITLSECARSTEPKTIYNKNALYKTWDMETQGLATRWMKKEQDSSTQLFFSAYGVLSSLIDDLKEKSMNDKEKRKLRAAEARFANALTSCPHWWARPDSIVGKQFARDILRCIEHIQKLGYRVSEDKRNLLKIAKNLEQSPFIEKAGVKYKIEE